MLALVEDQWCEIDLAVPPKGEISAYLTQPNGNFGRFELKKGTRVVHFGAKYFVMKTNGSIKVKLDHSTGVYSTKGKGTAILRAIIDGQHFDRELTT